MTCCRKTLALAFCLFFIFHLTAQDSLKVYPTHWWVGMKQSKIQLLVRAPNIKSARRVVLKPYPGVKLTSVQTHTSANYLTIYLDIGKTAAPGTLSFTFNNGATQVTQMSYTLRPRSNQNGKTRIKGINSSDLIYLIMPDRFSNGDAGNDRIAGLRDQSLDRSDFFKRHGGDLKGIQNHLIICNNWV